MLQTQLKQVCVDTGQTSNLLGMKEFRVPRKEFAATDHVAMKKKALIKRFVEHLGMDRSRVAMFDCHIDDLVTASAGVQEGEDSTMGVLAKALPTVASFYVANHHFHPELHVSGRLTTPLTKEEARKVGIYHSSDQYKDPSRKIWFLKVPNFTVRNVEDHIAALQGTSARASRLANRNIEVTPSPGATVEVTDTYSTPFVDGDLNSSTPMASMTVPCSGLAREDLKNYAEKSDQNLAYCARNWSRFRGDWRSNDCDLFTISNPVSLVQRCQSCLREHRNMTKWHPTISGTKRPAEASPGTKQKRQKADSNYAFSLLSPESKTIRYRNKTKEHRREYKAKNYLRKKIDDQKESFNLHDDDEKGRAFFEKVCSYVTENSDKVLPMIIETMVSENIGVDPNSDDVQGKTEDCQQFAEELLQHIKNYKAVLEGKPTQARFSASVMRTALSAFLMSKKNYGEKGSQKWFLASETWKNMRCGIRGFCLYARYVLELEHCAPKYVRALDSNSSSLEAWFSCVRRGGHDTAAAYGGFVGAADLAGEKTVLKSNPMYSEEHVSDAAPQREDRLLSITGRRDTPRREWIQSLLGNRKCVAKETTNLFPEEWRLPVSLKGKTSPAREFLGQMARESSIEHSFQNQLLLDPLFLEYAKISWSTQQSQWFLSLLNLEKEGCLQFEVFCQQVCGDLLSEMAKGLAVSKKNVNSVYSVRVLAYETGEACFSNRVLSLPTILQDRRWASIVLEFLSRMVVNSFYEGLDKYLPEMKIAPAVPVENLSKVYWRCTPRNLLAPAW